MLLTQRHSKVPAREASLWQGHLPVARLLSRYVSGRSLSLSQSTGLDGSILTIRLPWPEYTTDSGHYDEASLADATSLPPFVLVGWDIYASIWHTLLVKADVGSQHDGFTGRVEACLRQCPDPEALSSREPDVRSRTTATALLSRSGGSEASRQKL